MEPSDSGWVENGMDSVLFTMRLAILSMTVKLD